MDYETILKNSLELAQRLAEHQPNQGEFGWSETERQRLEQFRDYYALDNLIPLDGQKPRGKG